MRQPAAENAPIPRKALLRFCCGSWVVGFWVFYSIHSSASISQNKRFIACLRSAKDTTSSVWGEISQTLDTTPGTLEHDAAQHGSELQLPICAVAPTTHGRVTPISTPRLHSCSPVSASRRLQHCLCKRSVHTTLNSRSIVSFQKHDLFSWKISQDRCPSLHSGESEERTWKG